MCLNIEQVARAGRFGTKGLAITFVSDESDAKVLNDVQERFEVNITELPEEIDLSSYSMYSTAYCVAAFTSILYYGLIRQIKFDAIPRIAS